MKKLLTIALALVMVLALAAPAMATVGFGPQPETTPATKTEWSVKIRALEFIPATNGFTFENNYYADYDPTKGIVAGSDIRFVVDVTFPKTGDIADADMFERNLKNMALVVSGNNLAFGWTSIASILGLTTRGHEFVNDSLPRITTNSPTKTVYYMSDNLVDYSEYPFKYDHEEINTVYYMFNCQKDLHLSKYYTTTYSFMFVADVLKTADVTVTAIMSAAGSSSQFAPKGTYRFTYNNNTYSVQHSTSTGVNYYDMWNEKDARKVVRFTTDSKDQITNVAVTTNSGTAFGYTTVTPLTTAQFNAAQLIVNAIAAGTDTKRVEAV